MVSSRSDSSANARPVTFELRPAIRSTRWYTAALCHDETMLDPPSATAVAVGMAIRSTSRDRTRQLRSIRPEDLAGPARPAGPPADLGSSTSPDAPSTDRSVGCPRSALWALTGG